MGKTEPGPLVRAIRPGFYGGNRIRAGMTFRLAAGVPMGKWMEVVEGSVEDDLARKLEEHMRTATRARPDRGQRLTAPANVGAVPAGQAGDGSARRGSGDKAPLG